jgi:DNA adenine methylase
MEQERTKDYLANYLATIKGKSQQPYKRVSISPLRYAGGKSNAVGLILEHLPALKEKKIVSPFFGGGSFELVLAKHLGFQVIGYDIFAILVNFWNQAISNPKELADELERLVPDKEHFDRNRHILLSYWDKVKPATLEYTTRNKLELTEEERQRLDTNELLQAAYYYYNMQLSYGPMFLGWPSSVYVDEKKYKNIVKHMREFSAGNLSVQCADFETAIQAHPNDFLFLDPPYYMDGDSKMFKGMYPNCNFAIHHNSFQHARLRDLLKEHKGGFLMTYNNCSTIREWYADYKQVFPSWQYTYGQGEKRVGKNRADGATTKESHEIFIICPPP